MKQVTKRELPLIVELSGRAGSGKSTLRRAVMKKLNERGCETYEELWVGTGKDMVWVFRFLFRYPFRAAKGIYFILRNRKDWKIKRILQDIGMMGLVYGKIRRAEAFGGASIIDEGVSRRLPGSVQCLSIYPLERIDLIMAYIYSHSEARWERLVNRYKEGKPGHLGYHKEDPSSPRLKDEHVEFWRGHKHGTSLPQTVHLIVLDNSKSEALEPNRDQIIGIINEVAPSAERFLFMHGRS